MGLPYSLGLHPWFAEDLTPQQYQTLCKRLASTPEIWAVGEAGLDRLSMIPLQRQIHYFRLQVELSEQTQRPLIIHAVRSWSELLAIHREMNPREVWIVHGFRGKPALAEQLLRAGLYLSFGQYYQPEALSLAYEAGKLFLESDDAPLSIRNLYAQAGIALGAEPEHLRHSIFQSLLQIAPSLGRWHASL